MWEPTVFFNFLYLEKKFADRITCSGRLTEGHDIRCMPLVAYAVMYNGAIYICLVSEGLEQSS